MRKKGQSCRLMMRVFVQETSLEGFDSCSGEGRVLRASASVSDYPTVSKVCYGWQNFTGEIIADDQGGCIDDLYKTYSIFRVMQNSLGRRTLIGGHPWLLSLALLFRRRMLHPLWHHKVHWCRSWVTDRHPMRSLCFAPFANTWKFPWIGCFSRKHFALGFKQQAKYAAFFEFFFSVIQSCKAAHQGLAWK